MKFIRNRTQGQEIGWDIAIIKVQHFVTRIQFLSNWFRMSFNRAYCSFTGHCKISKTMTIQKTEGDGSFTCFSKNTVAVCRRHCVPGFLQNHNIRFVCFRTENSTVQRLTNKYASGITDLSGELTGFDANHEEEIEIPAKCDSNNWAINRTSKQSLIKYFAQVSTNSMPFNGIWYNYVNVIAPPLQTHF